MVIMVLVVFSPPPLVWLVAVGEVEVVAADALGVKWVFEETCEEVGKFMAVDEVDDEGCVDEVEVGGAGEGEGEATASFSGT